MTPTRPLLVILLSILCSSTAHLLLKLGSSDLFAGGAGVGFSTLVRALRSPWLLAGVSMHGLALLAWIYALGQAELSYVYPFIALGFVLTSIFAWGFLGETPSPARLSGMTVIVVGVLLVARG